MISKLAMSWSSSLSTVMSALVVLEVCLELLKLSYPVDLLRALTHSLPKWPSAILARQVIRSFQICLASPELPTMGKGDGRSKQNGRSNYNSNYKSGSSPPRKPSGGFDYDRDGGYNSPPRGQTRGCTGYRAGSSGKKSAKKSNGNRRRRSSSSSSSTSSSEARAARKKLKARALVLKSDFMYSKFAQDVEAAEVEKTIQKQGELLASVLRNKFDLALSAGAEVAKIGDSTGKPADSLGTGSASSLGEPRPVEEGFSPGQVEQLKSIISALIPTPPVAVAPGLPMTEDGTPSLPPTRTVAKGKSAFPGTLSQLQLALVHSMFGARLKLTPESTMTDFQTLAKEKWTQKAVPDGITAFLGEHLPEGTSVPKGKDARCAMFWETLMALD